MQIEGKEERMAHPVRGGEGEMAKLRPIRVYRTASDVLSRRNVEIFHWINLETLQLFAASLFAALDTDERRRKSVARIRASTTRNGKRNVYGGVFAC